MPDPLVDDSIIEEIQQALRPGAIITAGTVPLFLGGLDDVSREIALIGRTETGQAELLYHQLITGCFARAADLTHGVGDFSSLLAGFIESWIDSRQRAGRDATETARQILAWLVDDVYHLCSGLFPRVQKTLNRKGSMALARELVAHLERVRSGADVGDAETAPGSDRRLLMAISKALVAREQDAAGYLALSE